MACMPAELLAGYPRHTARPREQAPSRSDATTAASAGESVKPDRRRRPRKLDRAIRFPSYTDLKFMLLWGSHRVAAMEVTGMKRGGGRRLAALVPSEAERSFPGRRARRRRVARSLSDRCRMVLRCAEGSPNKVAVAELGVDHRRTVGT